MLIFIGPRRQTHTIRHLAPDGRRPRLAARSYSWLFRAWRLPAATYVFVAIDRLDVRERRLAAQFYRHLNGLGPGFRALNDPAVAMGRHRLLQSLHRAGINDFNACLASEPHVDLRFPVFVRSATQSLPPHTGLIEDKVALAAALDRLVAQGEPREDLLIIEHHAEAAVPGLYRKQAEYRFVDRYVPNASIYSRDWYVKYTNSETELPPGLLDEDARVMTENPFADVARRAFAIAGIEYGRADIGIVGGRPQIYEINFNPDLRSQRQRPNRNPILRELWSRSDAMVYEALTDLDVPRGRAAPTISNDELRQFRLRFWRNYAPQRY